MTIPFRLAHGVPLVSLAVNGRKGELFLVDSGFQRTTLNLNEAERLGVRTSHTSGGMSPGIGDSPGQPTFVTESLQLKFGWNILVKGQVPALSLGPLSEMVGERIAGIIGYDVLAGHPSVIDYFHSRLTLYEAKSFFVRRGAGVYALAVDKSALLPIVSSSVGIDGQDYGPIRLLIDIGSERMLTFRGSFVRDHSLEALEGWKPGVAFGLGGYADIRKGLAGWLTLDGHRIEIPNVAMSLATQGISATDRFDANVGNPILQGWTIAFDCQNGMIYLIDRTALADDAR